jgi:hypothetical protein
MVRKTELEALMVPAEHDELCLGHLDCPHCGRRTCGLPVAWNEPDHLPRLVLCLRCRRSSPVYCTGAPHLEEE